MGDARVQQHSYIEVRHRYWTSQNLSLGINGKQVDIGIILMSILPHSTCIAFRKNALTPSA